MGSVERNHREINRYLRQYLESNKDDWDTYLHYFSFSYNIEKHASNGYKYSPYELVYARTSNLPSDLLNGTISPIYNHDDYIKEAKFRIQSAHKAAAKVIDKLKLANKIQYDKNINPLDVKIGDTVYLKLEPYHKLSNIAKPCLVTAINHPNIIITDGVKSVEVHKNRVFK